MKTKKVHGVDLHSKCFAYIGSEDDTETWQCCIRVVGDQAKSINAVKSSLHRFDAVMMRIPDSARERAWYTLRGAGLVLGIDVAERSFTTQKAPAAEPVTPPTPEPEPVRIEPPAVTILKDLELDAIVAESDRRAEMWMRALGID